MRYMTPPCSRNNRKYYMIYLFDMNFYMEFAEFASNLPRQITTNTDLSCFCFPPSQCFFSEISTDLRSLFGTRVLHRCVGWHFVTLHLGNYLNAHHSPWWGPVGCVGRSRYIFLPKTFNRDIYIYNVTQDVTLIYLAKVGLKRKEPQTWRKTWKNLHPSFFVFLKSCFWSMAYCNGVMTGHVIW